MNRLSWLPILLGVTVFIVSLDVWLSFLVTDHCLDGGGVMEEGTCVGARYPVGFLEWSWVFKLFAILPPLLIAGFAAAFASSLMKVRDRDA